MKSKVVGILGALVTLAASSAYADQYADLKWHIALQCDGARIDNMEVPGGTKGGPGAIAQVVITGTDMITELQNGGVTQGYSEDPQGHKQWVGGGEVTFGAIPGQLIEFVFWGNNGPLGQSGFVRVDQFGKKYVEIDTIHLPLNGCVKP